MANILPNPGVKREQCVKECIGCEKMFSDENIGDVCIAYVNPKAIHRFGCPLQTNKPEETKKDSKKINPLKKSKRSRRG